MTETPERHPTYFEATNIFQRLADILPLVDKLCFVAEHGEVVHLRQIVNDVIGEMFRFRSLTCALDSNAEIVDRLRSFAACRDADRALATEAADEIVRLRGIVSGVLDGTHVIMPKEPTELMVAYARASLDAGHSPEILPREIWRVMVNAALDQEA